DIQHDGIPAFLADPLEGLAGVAGFAEVRLLEIVSQDLFQPAAHHGVVVCNQDSHGDQGRPVAPAVASGMRRLTFVPLPRRPTMVTSPSSMRARSRMPSKPRDLAPDRSRALRPWPLSCTSSMSWPRLASNLIFTRVALACRTILVRVSWKMRKTAVAWLGLKRISRKPETNSHLTPVRFWKSWICHSM